MESIRTNNNNPKLQLCRQHVPFEALYFLVVGLIVPPKENAVCTAAILDFLVMSSSLLKVLNHFRKVFGKVTTLSSLKVFF